MRIEYQDPSEASDAINDMLAQLADVRNANRALLAQLDEERASHAKSQEAYDNATAKLADRLADMTRRKDGWRGVAVEWRKRNEELWRCLREMRKDRNDGMSGEFGMSEETHVRLTSQYRRGERRARKSGER